MSSNYTKTKIITNTRKKTLNDKGLKIFVCLIILGYVFFFTSNYFFPKIYKYKQVARPSSSYSSNNMDILIGSIDYAKRDHEMEIILEYQDLLVEDGIKYDVTAKHDTDLFKAEITKKFDKYMVIRVSKLPVRFTECSINLTNGYEDVIFNINDKHVNEVKSIKNKSEAEYKAYEKDMVIKGYKDQISSKDKKIEDLKEKTELTQQKIDELTQDKEIATESEKNKIDNKVIELKQNIDAYNYDSDNLCDEIAELKQKIKLKEGE